MCPASVRFATVVALSIMSAGMGAAALYMSPAGRDDNPGTKARPFGTLEGARDAVRKLSPRQRRGGVTVWLRGGVYRLSRTFELDARDSGTAGAPVCYRAYGGERVIISGGRDLSPDAFHAVTDPAILARLPEESHGQVAEVDLRAQGITDFGVMRPHGWGRGYVDPGLELFFSDRPLQLARVDMPTLGTDEADAALRALMVACYDNQVRGLGARLPGP